MNSLTLTGRFGKDPEMKVLPNSTKKLCVVSLAENQGNKENPKTQWYSLQFWGDSADKIMLWAKKGMAVTVCGRLKLDEWEDNAGGKRTTAIVKVDQFQLAPATTAHEQVAVAHGETAVNGPVTTAPIQNPAPAVSDDEIPF